MYDNNVVFLFVKSRQGKFVRKRAIFMTIPHIVVLIKSATCPIDTPPNPLSRGDLSLISDPRFLLPDLCVLLPAANIQFFKRNEFCNKMKYNGYREVFRRFGKQ